MHLWVVLEGRVDLRFEMPDKRLASERHTFSNARAKRISLRGHSVVRYKYPLATHPPSTFTMLPVR